MSEIELLKTNNDWYTFEFKNLIPNIISEISNTIFNTELPNCINSVHINKNINTPKSHCINLIILSPRKINFVILVYPKLKDAIHENFPSN